MLFTPRPLVVGGDCRLVCAAALPFCKNRSMLLAFILQELHYVFFIFSVAYCDLDCVFIRFLSYFIIVFTFLVFLNLHVVKLSAAGNENFSWRVIKYLSIYLQIFILHTLSLCI